MSATLGCDVVDEPGNIALLVGVWVGGCPPSCMIVGSLLVDGFVKEGVSIDFGNHGKMSRIRSRAATLIIRCLRGGIDLAVSGA